MDQARRSPKCARMANVSVNAKEQRGEPPRCRKIQIKSMAQKLAKCLLVVKKYEWLLDSYVLDFYVDDHWQKLPLAWQRQLEKIPIEDFGELLQDQDLATSRHVWPLELLALRQLLRGLCISRKPRQEQTLPRCPLLEHQKLKHVFKKCVKPKKWHEITQMAAICARSCQLTKVDFVVDFGAGLGHLARVLGYGYGIRVCCFEMQPSLNEQAAIIDERLEDVAAKHLPSSERDHFQRPAHLTERLSADTSPAQFLTAIRQALELPPEIKLSFGIIGLHPCGDLGATLMRMFLDCAQAKFISFVGCCYQKLSTSQTQPTAPVHGYPLSSLLRQQLRNDIELCQLSYEAREISCHAVEMYCDRLAAGQYEYLKIHSFRAAAERIIVQHSPELKHSGLRSVKHEPGMSFDDYFQRAVQGTPLAGLLDLALLNQNETESDLLRWRRIVIFYTLRLMLAPLIESVILYDRALFLLENDCQVHIEAIFDPRLSPRNHITSALKS